MGMKYGGLGIAAFLYVGFTEWTGLSLACPFRWLTGLQCPGCGATRMVTALLHGRWEAAWQANPLLLLAMPWILLLVGVEEYCRYQQCPEPRWFMSLAGCWWPPFCFSALAAIFADALHIKNHPLPFRWEL